jgi:hypothetical protein
MEEMREGKMDVVGSANFSYLYVKENGEERSSRSHMR